jgi:hypothetical protein
MCLAIFSPPSKCQTAKEKVNELIGWHLEKSLGNLSGYQPIETVVDSVFFNIYEDTGIVGHVFDIMLFSNSCIKHIGCAKAALAEKNVKLSQRHSDSIIILLDKAKESGLKMKKLINEFKPTFGGYNIIHKFYQIKERSVVITEKTYFMDVENNIVFIDTLINRNKNVNELNNFIDRMKNYNVNGPNPVAFVPIF